MNVIRQPGLVLDTYFRRLEEMVYISSSSTSLNCLYALIYYIGVSTFLTDDEPGMTALIVIYLSFLLSFSLTRMKSRDIIIF